jgi:hypothetical protein
MHSDEPLPPAPDEQLIPPATVAFYRRTIRLLQQEGIPVIVAGARAFCCYTGIDRHTKDFDLLLRPADVEPALALARGAGLRAELSFPHWLGKIFGRNDDFIDLILRAGNGLWPVDDSWFARAPEHEILGMKLRLCPPEEMILTKAFVMERERYDGADIAHLLARAEGLDFAHLLEAFGEYWRLLLNQLVLFGFIYPAERNRIPRALMDELISRLQRELDEPPPKERVCRGTLISRAQFLPDLRQWGYRDARLQPQGPMTAEQIAHWTKAIDRPEPP